MHCSRDGDNILLNHPLKAIRMQLLRVAASYSQFNIHQRHFSEPRMLYCKHLKSDLHYTACWVTVERISHIYVVYDC